MRKPFHPLDKHKDHQVEIRRSPKAHGMYFYHCIECNKWVAWLSQADIASARELGLIQDRSKTVNN